MTEPTEHEERQLRLALRMIGDEANRPTPTPAPVTAPVPVRRRPYLIGAVAAGIAAVVVAGIALSGNGSGPTDADRADTGQGQTLLEWIACARTIAEGDITEVRDAPEKGRIVVSLTVQDWIKPTRGHERIQLDLVDPAVAEVNAPLRAGQHVLIAVPTRKDLEADTFTGHALAKKRKEITAHLPTARRTPCPPYWRTGTGPVHNE